MKDLTFGNGFNHLYEAKLFKMIFESILLDKVQESINKEKEKLSLDPNDSKYAEQVEKIMSTETFNWYKKTVITAGSLKIKFWPQKTL